MSLKVLEEVVLKIWLYAATIKKRLHTSDLQWQFYKEKILHMKQNIRARLESVRYHLVEKKTSIIYSIRCFRIIWAHSFSTCLLWVTVWSSIRDVHTCLLICFSSIVLMLKPQAFKEVLWWISKHTEMSSKKHTQETLCKKPSVWNKVARECLLSNGHFVPG